MLNLQSKFKPLHLNANQEDLQGNDGIGRYILIPGSDGRAKEIAKHFIDLKIKEHPRGHHLYLGTITHDNARIDVASISSGMGCPSMEIILHELFQLGAKRFLRVGTAGSLQTNIKFGDIVNASASVRDEKTTFDYVPVSFPAIASHEMIQSIILSSNIVGLRDHLHTGVVHCKSSFYGRQFGAGPLGEANRNYMDVLTQCGILATEMETATLFVQSQLFDYQLRKNNINPINRVLAGAILGVICDIKNEIFATTEEIQVTIDRLISLALLTIKSLATQESLQVKEMYASSNC